MSGATAFLARDHWPDGLSTAALVACGAVGYGLSLRLYLNAQRVLGAGRTGSLFAFGPFVGAALAFALGDRGGTLFIASAAACFLVALALHATERHGHGHRHDALEHEHAHSHDDGHHTHTHEPVFVGVHSHPHTHEALEHDHPHGVDVHHDHSHD
jgi:hypothetical protein